MSECHCAQLDAQRLFSHCSESSTLTSQQPTMVYSVKTDNRHFSEVGRILSSAVELYLRTLERGRQINIYLRNYAIEVIQGVLYLEGTFFD